MFSYFTIIDEKDLSGATSYLGENFTFGSDTAQKKAAPRLIVGRGRLLSGHNAIRLLQNLELVLMDFVLA